MGKNLVFWGFFLGVLVILAIGVFLMNQPHTVRVNLPEWNCQEKTVRLVSVVNGYATFEYHMANGDVASATVFIWLRRNVTYNYISKSCDTFQRQPFQ